MRGTRAIVDDFEGGPALYLLFDPGKRPALDDVRAALAASSRIVISQEPSVDDRDTVWLELLYDGLTFDLAGLAGHKSVGFPSVNYSLELPQDWSIADGEAVSLGPGPHLSGGGHILPVFRVWMAVADTLCTRLENLRAVVWGPASVAIGATAFVRLVEGWLAGGAFPSLALIGFSQQTEGTIRTDGLAFFTGQELLIDADLSLDRAQATRLAVRLIHECVSMGKLEESARFTGPDGAPLAISPLSDGNCLQVHRG